MSDSENPYLPPENSAAGTPVTPASAGAATPRALELFRQASPWAMFIAVMSFIGAGFMVLFGLIFTVIGGLAGAAMSAAMGAGLGGAAGAIIGVVYLAAGGVMFIPSVLTLRLSKQMKKFGSSEDPLALEGTAKAVKGIYKFSGIMIIVSFALCIVAMIVGVGIAMSAVSSMGNY